MWLRVGLLLLFLGIFAHAEEQQNLPGTLHKRAYLSVGDLNADGKDDVIAVTSHPDPVNQRFTSQIHWYFGSASPRDHYLSYQGVAGFTFGASPGRLIAKPIVIQGTAGLPARVAILLEDAPYIGGSTSHLLTKFLEIYECSNRCQQLNHLRTYALNSQTQPLGSNFDFQILTPHLFSAHRDFDQDGYDDVLLAWSEGDPSGQAVLPWQNQSSAGVGRMHVTVIDQNSINLPSSNWISWTTQVLPILGSIVLDEIGGVGEVFDPVQGRQTHRVELALGTSSRSALLSFPGFAMERVSYDQTLGLQHHPADRLSVFQSGPHLKLSERENRLTTDYIHDLHHGFVIGGFIHENFRSPIIQLGSRFGNFGVQLLPTGAGFFPYANTRDGMHPIYLEGGERVFQESVGDYFGNAAEEVAFAIRRAPINGSLVTFGPSQNTTLVVSGLEWGGATPYLLETYPDAILSVVGGDFNGDQKRDLLVATGRTFHKFGVQSIPGRFSLWLGEGNGSQRRLERAY